MGKIKSRSKMESGSNDRNDVINEITQSDAPVDDAGVAGMVHEAGTGIKSDRDAILENSLKFLFEVRLG